MGTVWHTAAANPTPILPIALQTPYQHTESIAIAVAQLERFMLNRLHCGPQQETIIGEQGTSLPEEYGADPIWQQIHLTTAHVLATLQLWHPNWSLPLRLFAPVGGLGRKSCAQHFLPIQFKAGQMISQPSHAAVTGMHWAVPVGDCKLPCFNSIPQSLTSTWRAVI